MTRTAIPRARAAEILADYEARLDALAAEVAARAESGDAFEPLIAERLAEERERLERALAEAAVPRGVAECDA